MMPYMWSYGLGGLIGPLVLIFLVLGIASMVKYLLSGRKPPAS